MWADEGGVGRRARQRADALLVAGHGRVAPPGRHPAAQVVAVRDRPGGAQRVGPRDAHPQHAHTHVRLLPEQVPGRLAAPPGGRLPNRERSRHRSVSRLDWPIPSVGTIIDHNR